MLFQLRAGDSMRDSDHVKSRVPGTGDIVRSISDNNRPTHIKLGAEFFSESLGDHGRKLEALTRIITERAYTQIQVLVQTGYTKFDFSCYT